MSQTLNDVDEVQERTFRKWSALQTIADEETYADCALRYKAEYQTRSRQLSPYELAGQRLVRWCEAHPTDGQFETHFQFIRLISARKSWVSPRPVVDLIIP